jgi:hypothetical protein
VSAEVGRHAKADAMTDDLMDRARRITGGSAVVEVVHELIERVQQAEAERAAARTRVITTVAELDALPIGSVVLDSDGDAWKRYGRDAWGCTEDLTITRWETALVAAKCLPARVLYEPEEG